MRGVFIGLKLIQTLSLKTSHLRFPGSRRYHRQCQFDTDTTLDGTTAQSGSTTTWEDVLGGTTTQTSGTTACSLSEAMSGLYHRLT